MGRLELEGINDRTAQMRALFRCGGCAKKCPELEISAFPVQLHAIVSRGQEAPLCCTYCRHLASKLGETADSKKALLSGQSLQTGSRAKDSSEWLYLDSVPLAVKATYDGVHMGCGCVGDTESSFRQHDGFEAMGTLQFRKLLSHII